MRQQSSKDLLFQKEARISLPLKYYIRLQLMSTLSRRLSLKGQILLSCALKPL